MTGDAGEQLPAFYVLEGDRYVPTGRGLSPWNGTTQNGVSLAGLAAHVLSRVPSAPGMHPVRVTLDILGLVPMAPVEARTRVVRDGRRVQLVELEFVIEGRSWVRASMLRLRTEPSPEVPQPPTQAFGDAPPVLRSRTGIESRKLFGDFGVPGPAAHWARFTLPVVHGEPLAPLEQAMMLSDFAAGIGPLISTKEWTLANLDITLNLSRLPRGEWLLMDCQSESAGNGIAVARGRISDRESACGTVALSVFVDRRG